MGVAAWSPGLRVISQAVSGLSWKEFCDQVTVFLWGSHRGSSGITFYQCLKWAIRDCTLVLAKDSEMDKAVLFILTLWPPKLHLSHWQDG